MSDRYDEQAAELVSTYLRNRAASLKGDAGYQYEVPMQEVIAAALRAAHQAGREEAGAEISAMMRNTELSP